MNDNITTWNFYHSPLSDPNVETNVFQKCYKVSYRIKNNKNAQFYICAPVFNDTPSPWSKVIIAKLGELYAVGENMENALDNIYLGLLKNQDKKQLSRIKIIREIFRILLKSK